MPRRNHPKYGAQRSKRSLKGQTMARITSPVVVICPTGKRGFPRHVAEAKLEAYSNDTTRRTVPQRIYPCDLCGSFHLTSQVRNEGR